jgi:hypothetical protein
MMRFGRTLWILRQRIFFLPSLPPAASPPSVLDLIVRYLRPKKIRHRTDKANQGASVPDCGFPVEGGPNVKCTSNEQSLSSQRVINPSSTSLATHFNPDLRVTGLPEKPYEPKGRFRDLLAVPLRLRFDRFQAHLIVEIGQFSAHYSERKQRRSTVTPSAPLAPRLTEA